MSDTPRTDEKREIAKSLDWNEACVWEWAEQLEREIAEVREEWARERAAMAALRDKLNDALLTATQALGNASMELDCLAHQYGGPDEDYDRAISAAKAASSARDKAFAMLTSNPDKAEGGEAMTELSTTFKELERENAALREAVAEARAILKLWEDTETDPQDGEEYDEFMEGFTARVARFLVETEGRSQATVVPIIDGLIGRPIPPHASGPPAFYHQIPKVGACAHEWDRQEFPQQCVKCGMSFLTHIHMELL